MKQNTCVQIYTVILHYYKWFWQNEVIWGHLFPEMIIRDLRIISIHVVWWPMALPERWSWETWKDMVTNEHLVKCVKVCLIDIRFSKWQNNMETRQCKYCLSISLYLGELWAWNVSNLHMEWLWRSLTILTCVVVKWKVKQEGHEKRYKLEKRKVKNVWCMLGEKWLKLSSLT